MIPAPVPVFPIAAVLVLTAGAFLYAAVLAARAAGRSEAGTKARGRGVALAATAAALALGASGLLVNILAVHDGNYTKAVWAALEEDFGVLPAVDGQGFRDGAAFPALLNGADAVCTVAVPRTVSCDGVLLAPADS